MCACITTNYQPLSFSTFQNSEGFIGLTLNAGKSEIYVLDRRTERKGRKKDRAEGRTQVKTGLFEAAGLLETVLLLLTPLNNENRQLNRSWFDDSTVLTQLFSKDFKQYSSIISAKCCSYSVVKLLWF